MFFGMEEEKDTGFECPICLDLPTDPRRLRCNHSFCCECLEGVVTPCGAIKCPLCRRFTVSQPVELPKDNAVSRFASNLGRREVKSARVTTSRPAADRFSRYGHGRPQVHSAWSSRIRISSRRRPPSVDRTRSGSRASLNTIVPITTIRYEGQQRIRVQESETSPRCCYSSRWKTALFVIMIVVPQFIGPIILMYNFIGKDKSDPSSPPTTTIGNTPPIPSAIVSQSGIQGSIIHTQTNSKILQTSSSSTTRFQLLSSERTTEENPSQNNVETVTIPNSGAATGLHKRVTIVITCSVIHTLLYKLMLL